MEQFPILDIVIGLTLIYTFLSLLASGLTNAVLRMLHWRTNYFVWGVATLLGETSKLRSGSEAFKNTISYQLLSSLTSNSQVDSFTWQNHSIFPSEVPPQLFAETLLNILNHLPQSHQASKQYEGISLNAIANLLSIIEFSPAVSPQLKVNLQRMIQRVQSLDTDAEQQMVRLQQELGLWFSYVMADVANTYRQRFKWASFLVSAVLVIAVNIDSLYIIRRISENTAMRAMIMQNAIHIKGCQDQLNSPNCSKRLSFLMQRTTIPIGWQSSNRHKQFAQLNGVILLRTIGGWFLSSIAIAMGSRFWLQILNHLSRFWGGESKSEQTTQSAAPDRDRK